MQIEWKRNLYILGITVGVILSVHFILPAVIPFLIAWNLAEMIYPLAAKAEKRTKISKNIWGYICITGGFIAFGIIGYISICEIFEQVSKLLNEIPDIYKKGEVILETGREFIEQKFGISAATGENYIEKVMTEMQGYLTLSQNNFVFDKISSGTKCIFAGIAGIFTTYIMAILILQEMDKLRKKMREYRLLNGIRRIIYRLKKTTLVYLKAQFLIMVLIAIVSIFALWIIRNQYFMLFGVLLAILDVLPLIGTGIFLIPAAGILLLKGEGWKAIVCVLLMIINNLLRRFLESALLGERLGISPLWIVSSIYIGMFLFGARGVLLGPLVFSIINEIGKEWDVWG